MTAFEEPICSSSHELLEEMLTQSNLLAAQKRVETNRGAPGIDGMGVEQLSSHLQQVWPALRDQLLSGTYQPQAVRAVYLPKPGGGQRMLGIPTVVDRFITQALQQVLTPIFEPGFSPHSYGFRPGRSAHQAVTQAQHYMSEGYRWVVDLDLEKFFDQVHHDLLMSRVARQVQDKRVLKLIRAYLKAGIMQGGLVSQREQGVPQGSPLSPLLSNILLTDFDQELERRGHRFCRYADDANIYVRSRRAGERVMASLTHYLESTLRLKVNRDKSAVARPWDRQFLGYTVTNHRTPRLKPAPKSVHRAKERIREITHRGRGRNILQVIKEVNQYLRGWFGYYRLSQVTRVFDELDQWIRRRLRKILWEQWKTPRTRYRKLVNLGLGAERARKAVATGRAAWWNAGASHMHAAVTKALLHQWGLFSLLNPFMARQRVA